MNSKLYKTPFYKYLVLPIISFGWIVAVASTIFIYMTTGEPNYWALLIFIPGFVLFLIAKWQVIKSGMLFSFGTTAAERMSKRNKWFYYCGYLLMIVGFVLTFQH